MELIFDDQAVADLEGIFNWISQDSPDAARKVTDRLLKSIGLLTPFRSWGTSGMIPRHSSGSSRGCPMS
jgi:toxin ParE1/3/4